MPGIGSYISALAQGYTGGLAKGEQAKIALQNQLENQELRREQIKSMREYRTAQAKAKIGEGNAAAEKAIRQGLFKYGSDLRRIYTDPQGADTRAGLAAQGIDPEDLLREAARATAAAVGPSPGQFTPHFGGAFGISVAGGDAQGEDLLGGSRLGGAGGATAAPTTPPLSNPMETISPARFPSATPPGFSSLGREGTFIGQGQPRSAAPRLNPSRMAALNAAVGGGPVSTPVAPPIQLAAVPPAPSLTDRYAPSPKTQSTIEKNKATAGLATARTGHIGFEEGLANRKLKEIRDENMRRQKRWEGDHNEAIRTRQGMEGYRARMAAVAEGNLAVERALQEPRKNLMTAQAAEANAKVAEAMNALSDKDQAILKGVGPIYKEIKGKGGETIGYQYDPVAGGIYAEMFGLNLSSAPALGTGAINLPEAGATAAPGGRILPEGYQPGNRLGGKVAAPPAKKGKTTGKAAPEKQGAALKALNAQPDEIEHVTAWAQANKWNEYLSKLPTAKDKARAQNILRALQLPK